LFLEGKRTDLVRSLQQRMTDAAAAQEYERAARYRDLISTVEQLQERQRIATTEGDDADVFGYHCENGMLAVNLFHMRGGKIVDRREFFWEDLPEFGTTIEPAPIHVDTAVQPEESAPLAAESFHPEALFSALLNQLYIGQPYVPRNVYVPVDFEDREALEDLLSEQLAAEGSRATRVHIEVPQRGEKRSLIDLAATNAKQSYDQRFRVMKPNMRMIQEALARRARSR
jgi:excinuclease ABC subunit C